VAAGTLMVEPTESEDRTSGTVRRGHDRDQGRDDQGGWRGTGRPTTQPAAQSPAHGRVSIAGEWPASVLADRFAARSGRVDPRLQVLAAALRRIDGLRSATQTWCCESRRSVR